METRNKPDAPQPGNYIDFTWLRFGRGFKLETVWLVLDKDEGIENYNPLECREMALQFAAVENAQGALNFANEFGFLGLYDKPGLVHEIFPQAPDSVREPVELWLRESFGARHVLRVIEQIEAYDLPSLRKIIRWDGDEVYVEVGTQRIPVDLLRHKRIVKTWKRGELVRPAKMYVAEQINWRLWNEASFGVRLKNNDLEPFVTPSNLLAAIWLQLADIATGAKKIKPCKICKVLMDVTGNRSHKEMHDLCSVKERMQRYREGKRLNDKKTRPE